MCLRAFILPVTHLSLFHRCASVCVSVYSPCSLTLCSLFLPSVFKGIKWRAPLLKTKPMLQVQKDERYSFGSHGCFRKKWLKTCFATGVEKLNDWGVNCVFVAFTIVCSFFHCTTNWGSMRLLFWEKTHWQTNSLHCWNILIAEYNSWKQSLTSLGLMKAPDCSPQENRGNANISLWSGLIIVWE